MTMQRVELRYATNASLEEIVLHLSKIAFIEHFPKSHTHTVYFDNQECTLPFEISLKARRYAESELGQQFRLRSEDECIFEIKEGFMHEGWYLVKKKRETTTYGSIPASMPLNVPYAVQPIYATCYQRQHWRLSSNPDVRITLDKDTNFYLVDNWQGERIGAEDRTLIELKLPLETLSQYLPLLETLMQQFQAVPTISKKDAVHNAFNSFIKRKYQLPHIITDTEIEAKLSLSISQQNVFQKIKCDFSNGMIDGFDLVREFPFTLERALLNAFVISPNGEYYRTSIDGNIKRDVTKETDFVFHDLYGLNCVVSRREYPAKIPEQLDGYPKKIMYRKRKYFLVCNTSGQKFSVLMDKSTYKGNALYQIEVEWVGKIPSQEEKINAAKDISKIVYHIVGKYGLNPTTLTKLEWLRNL